MKKPHPQSAEAEEAFGSSPANLFRRTISVWLWALPLLWTLLVGAAWWWNMAHVEKTILDLAQTEAKASFEKDLLYRQWATLHGGVWILGLAVFGAGGWQIQRRRRERDRAVAAIRESDETARQIAAEASTLESLSGSDKNPA